jgi:hypothetical protein
MKKLPIGLALLFAFGAAAPLCAQTSAGTENVFINDTSCKTATPCTAQVYRATGACPATGAAPAFTELTAAMPGTTISATSTAWTYADTTPVPGTSYCYYATVTYVAGGAPSAPSGSLTQAVPLPYPAIPSSFSISWTPANP